MTTVRTVSELEALKDADPRVPMMTHGGLLTRAGALAYTIRTGPFSAEEMDMFPARVLSARTVSKADIDDVVMGELGPNSTWPDQDKAHEIVCAALTALGFEVTE